MTDTDTADEPPLPGIERWSNATGTVLLRLSCTEAETYGIDLIKNHGVGEGAAYAILHRLHHAGLLLTRTETDAERRRAARPLRTYYRLNPAYWTAVDKELTRRGYLRPEAEHDAYPGAEDGSAGWALRSHLWRCPRCEDALRCSGPLRTAMCDEGRTLYDAMPDNLDMTEKETQ